MRLLLRRLAAVVIALSVLSLTLGLAHVPCDGMGAAAAGMASHGADGSMSDDCGQPSSTAPADDASGMAACLFVAHCGPTMIAAGAVAELVAHPAAGRLAAADETGPRELVLEPDSPPPRA